MAKIHIKGNEVNLIGNDVNVGDLAPCVKVVGQDFSEFEVGGKKEFVEVLVVVPSLDTSVCAAETRRFNEEAAKLENTQVSVVSMDLPFAMGRFCTTEGIKDLKVGSDFRNKDLANAYGLLMEDGALAGITARAVFVIDVDGKITYKEICDELTNEPNYKAAIDAAKSCRD